MLLSKSRASKPWRGAPKAARGRGSWGWAALPLALLDPGLLSGEVPCGFLRHRSGQVPGQPRPSGSQDLLMSIPP